MERLNNNQEFQQAIDQSGVTVVKFFTTWCPDCRKLNTFISDIVEDYKSLNWYEVNGEDVPDISEKYDVRGVPSLLVFQDGEKIAHLHSKYTKSPAQIREFLVTIE